MSLREAVELYSAGANISYIASKLGLSGDEVEIVKKASMYVKQGLTIDEAIGVAREAIKSGVDDAKVTIVSYGVQESFIDQLILNVITLMVILTLFKFMLDVVTKIVSTQIGVLVAGKVS